MHAMLAMGHAVAEPITGREAFCWPWKHLRALTAAKAAATKAIVRTVAAREWVGVILDSDWVVKIDDWRDD